MLYAFCEPCGHLDNFRFFVALGMQCPLTHYVIIVNGPCKEPMPEEGPNVTVIHRENKGFDFGAWAAGLARISIHDYSHFVFLNGSCCGPILPESVPCSEWVSRFCSRLTGAVHCVGPTINIYKMQPLCKPHVQTYAWAATKECVQMLLDAGQFQFVGVTKDDVIARQEVGSSTLVLAHGWDIACFVPEFDAVVSYQPHNEAQLRSFNPSGDKYHGDISVPQPLCFGRELSPEELMFIKTNRGRSSFRSQMQRARERAFGSSGTAPRLAHAFAYTYTYGSNLKYKDVTHVVHEMLTRGCTTIPVSNAAFGDPHFGVVKHLAVLHGGKRIAHVMEGNEMNYLESAVPASSFTALTPVFAGKVGLEIGGPSLYLHPLGVYTAPARLDNANYSVKTLWDTSLTDGQEYAFPGKTCPGSTFIVDAVQVGLRFPAHSYDFVLSSHVLEHLVNPLKALHQMSMITRPGGHAVHILPWKHATFDHRRPITPFAELVQHFEEDRDESDVSDHLDEVRAFYDLSRDVPAGTWDQFLERCAHHAENRALHVHVFDFQLLAQCMEHVGFRVLETQLVAPNHQLVLAQKRE